MPYCFKGAPLCIIEAMATLSDRWVSVCLPQLSHHTRHLLADFWMSRVGSETADSLHHRGHHVHQSMIWFEHTITAYCIYTWLEVAKVYCISGFPTEIIKNIIHMDVNSHKCNHMCKLTGYLPGVNAVATLCPCKRDLKMKADYNSGKHSNNYGRTILMLIKPHSPEFIMFLATFSQICAYNITVRNWTDLHTSAITCSPFFSQL